VEDIDTDFLPDGSFFLTLNREVIAIEVRDLITRLCSNLLAGFTATDCLPIRVDQVQTGFDQDVTDAFLQRFVNHVPKRPPYTGCVWKTADGIPVFSVANQGERSTIWEITCDVSAVEDDQMHRIQGLFQQLHDRLLSLAIDGDEWSSSMI
jgi:hypothetical protein